MYRLIAGVFNPVNKSGWDEGDISRGDVVNLNVLRFANNSNARTSRHDVIHLCCVRMYMRIAFCTRFQYYRLESESVQCWECLFIGATDLPARYGFSERF